jgi:cellobiose phosphorylase
MEQHGSVLAAAHVVRKFGLRNPLLRRLDENEQVLTDTRLLLATMVKLQLRITPAGEWLLDNFYLVETQIRAARKHLPRSYSRELPRLALGPSVGLPRVYDLALEAISHGDGRVDAETLARFVAAYQSVTPLLLGELWAIPIMLRLALIENLRRVAARISTAREHANRAREWAEQMMAVAQSDPKSLVLVIADMARSDPPMASSFVAELARRLQGHGPALAWPLTWIEQRLAESSLTIEQMVVSENQRQAADQVSISNTIGSLRFLGAMDWREFVERMSGVEQILRGDPGGGYRSMDFQTRDRYRIVVDRLAKRSAVAEADVARAAIGLAQVQAAARGSADRSAHVGYFLIDAGLSRLEDALPLHDAALRRLRRYARSRALRLYAGVILGLTAIAAGSLIWQAADDGVEDLRLAALVVLGLLAASQLATALTNWLVTLLWTPHPLPRLDLTDGLPVDLRTVVAVPAMLISHAGVDELLEELEVRFLGNHDPQLHFALLTDFRDAPRASMDEDGPLLARACRGIEELNEKYRRSNDDRFYLLHRPRLWNPAESTWMGYERKRGKLAALNTLLRGGGSAAFASTVGRVAALQGVRYVITLDTDTRLPRDAARQLVSAMAHPLNRPCLDPARRIVTAGYGILQPGMATSLSRRGRSHFARWSGSEPGIDPYTRSVSNVYQDLFGEGSFIGKGIYDIDAFEYTLKDRLPENRILSHDLLEGCYARSGLLSDVSLFEEYPAGYLEDMQRHRRWTRGDWQIAAWCLPSAPGEDGRKQRNPLSALSRWKILDNLRRGLAVEALVLLPILGWTVLPRPALWTVATAAVFLLPPMLEVAAGLARRPADTRLWAHLTGTLAATWRNLALALFRIACLPYEAGIVLGTTLRTLWRMTVSHRRMLEWRVASPLPATAARTLAAHLRVMWICPVGAALVFGGLALIRPEVLTAALPLLLLWCGAPIAAWWLGRSTMRHEASLSADQEIFLRRNARRTWAFFERFVTADDHWLPPDNFQESPGPLLAHRTSPTNIGMALLANLSAYDFGYVTAGALVERTQNTFRTLVSLERHEGHFFNWYDTRTLEPMRPRYVSSVDSGNLAGHLLTLGAGLLDLADRPLVGRRLFEGLADTWTVLVGLLPRDESMPRLREHMSRLSPTLQRLLPGATPAPRAGRRSWIPSSGASRVRGANGAAARGADAGGLQEVQRRLAQVAAQSAGLGVAAAAESESGSEVGRWASAFEAECAAAAAELRWFAPWLDLPPWPGAPIDRAIGRADLDLHELARAESSIMTRLDESSRGSLAPADRESVDAWRLALASGIRRARERIALYRRLADEAHQLAVMDFEFLYDRARHLLAIGYNVDEFRRDTSFYDLLASEARLTTFVGIAQGRLPQESWFALGRLLTMVDGHPVLVSWSGSMFEYLMPLLVMPSYEGTLLDQTCRGAVQRQIEYGAQCLLPWGISESGYSTVDANLNYQYHAFGIPGLGLKRGLAEDAVIAPYATVLALMLDPQAACANLQRLAGLGLEGCFGFYEAIDFTPSRLARGQSSVIVRSFMAHHQGMNLLALAHHLLGRQMQRRFGAVPSFQATLLLLQERIPKAAIVLEDVPEHSGASDLAEAGAVAVEAPLRADTATPEVQLLSNGRYHVMVTNAGGGYSRWQGLALTRWREDATRDNWGSFLYLRDAEGGAFWSAAHQPTRQRAERYEAMFSEGRAEFRRRDRDFETYSEIVVSPEDDIELRRLRIGNRARRRRSIEITSYAEVVLAQQAADLMQPTFGNLFVQTQILPERQAILCTRRPRALGETVPWLFHLFAVHGAEVEEASFETDRMRFIGRGREAAEPRALVEPGALSGTDGSVLDPIVAIRMRIGLDAEQSATLDVVTGAAPTREACLALIDKYRDRHLADRVFDLAMTHSGVTLRQIDASEADAHLYRRLAGAILYANGSMRAAAEVLLRNRRGQSGLWGYAISGDLPIVLLRVSNPNHIELVRQVIRCHDYWRLKGLAVDLVIWNEENPSYRARLQEQIIGLIAHGVEANAMNRSGGIFVRSPNDQVPSEDRVLLQTVARVVLSGDRGTLTDQVNRRSLSEKRPARLVPVRVHRPEPAAAPAALPPGWLLGNGIGGYSADGGEYRIQTALTRSTPLPWVNVIANPQFGTVVTESGPGYTWGRNAHEYRLTPWSDDPVGASGGEAIYLRDEETGYFWSPTPWPARGSQPYLSRHGFGYSVFEHTAGGIRSELWIYVDADRPVKYSVLKVLNGSGRARSLSVTGFVEWVLGDTRSKTAMHLVTEIDPASGALLARNPYSTDFAACVAFFDVDDPSRTLSGDRTEFLGRNGSPSNPEAMSRGVLSGRLGAALDPCGVIRVPFDLADGQEREFIFRLGMGDDLAQAQALALQLREAGTARLALQRARETWRVTLGAVQIETPDPALNVLANGWLVYQTLSARLWGRSGYFQSGGAFGFRDQLQDVMALVHAEPQRVREHLLLCASRQYREGDVQHWWHPPSGRGVRTRCSDDSLWLPLAVCRYVAVTGDRGVLDEGAHFIEGRPLDAEEESYYDVPVRSVEAATLYEHCRRTVERALRMGTHGLPLMGSGDWNDGMNLVGIEGRGESIWLGFFFYRVLVDFSALALRHGDAAFAARARAAAVGLQASLERSGWDGQWYRRAYFDDGTPLGSSSNAECRIDAIAQSWAVLSGAADPVRAALAMDELDRQLVDRRHRLVRLLAPPFDTSSLNPGYIRGYVPGVRENGGQYTHAAIWAAMAFAALGDGRRAGELLDMINPVQHARDPAGVAIYRAEPYVVAADVYALAPHAGRGGWSWYTASSGWLYRLIVESILGLQREGDLLRLTPCLPPSWPGFSMSYRFGKTGYRIVVTQETAGATVARLRLDGVEQDASVIALIDDRRDHLIELHLACAPVVASTS